MKRLQAFKYELIPTGEQKRQLSRFAGSCRFVFNKALALQQDRRQKGEKKLGYAGMCRLLTEWRNTSETGWLAEIHSQVLQQSLKDLERAFRNFFEKRADFPRFKKRGRHDTFRFPQGFNLDQTNSRIFLPKLGWLRYRNSRPVLGDVKNITVSRSGDKWFVSIQTELEVEQSIHPSGSIVGIDVGVVRFATLSDGTVFEPINSFNRYQQKQAHYQRAMSRKQKFSKNWHKAKTKVQRIRQKIANTRRDHLHKTTTTISQNHAVVCIEDLRVKNMSTSAAGTIEQPGRNVKAKSGLNRAILDQGWAEFRCQLEYKQAWRGGLVIAVPPRNTSRTCPACGHVAVENRPTQARFACVECGYEENADLVGALNILRAGHARLACGEMALLGHSTKQEPTEAIRADVGA
ncbi:MAG: transposase [Nitrospirae bacterium]|nr:transposase [Nitrospirota bacterium]